MIPQPPERYRAPEQRTVLPELLDDLPVNDPHAQASRRDLIRINNILGNYRFLRRELFRHVKYQDGCLEIGAGSGQLSTMLNRDQKFPVISGLDLAPRPENWPVHWPWLQQDLFDSTAPADADLVMASLFLHHFTDKQLQELGRRFTSNTRVLILVEPLRSSFAHRLARLAEMTGIDPVTRHDMHISIDAGFRRGELTELLGLSGKQWDIREQEDWRGSLRVVACRK